jgi:hypothetical protein
MIVFATIPVGLTGAGLEHVFRSGFAKSAAAEEPAGHAGHAAALAPAASAPEPPGWDRCQSTRRAVGERR